MEVIGILKEANPYTIKGCGNHLLQPFLKSYRFHYGHYLCDFLFVTSVHITVYFLFCFTYWKYAHIILSIYSCF